MGTEISAIAIAVGIVYLAGRVIEHWSWSKTVGAALIAALLVQLGAELARLA